ncbi:MAG: c-type cytochrome domain-containing protein, partial [Planctomycetaceae bacterium]
MKNSPIIFAVMWSLTCWLSGSLPADDASPSKIDFNRDIRPLLSNNCFACHGPDEKKRKGDLRLDIRGALGNPENTAIVVPGHPEQSELYQRLVSTDPETMMPPPSFNHALTDAQKNLIRDWIAEG